MHCLSQMKNGGGCVKSAARDIKIAHMNWSHDVGAMMGQDHVSIFAVY